MAAGTRTAQHTPGPWTIEILDGYITGHITSPAHTYCGNGAERRDSITAPSSMTRDDARLIAAAPELLAALDDLLGDVENLASHSVRDRMSVANARAAIRRATEGKD